jgi:nucleolysin TIA-1/TIAR
VSAADLFSYERSFALSKMAANPGLMGVGQHASLRQAAMGMGAGASQAIYDGGFQSVNPQQQQQQQQLMYY